VTKLIGEAAVSHGWFFVFMVLYSQAAKVTGQQRWCASDFLPDENRPFVDWTSYDYYIFVKKKEKRS
jgi:hypothetical protein